MGKGRSEDLTVMVIFESLTAHGRGVILLCLVGPIPRRISVSLRPRWSSLGKLCGYLVASYLQQVCEPKVRVLKIMLQ